MFVKQAEFDLSNRNTLVCEEFQFKPYRRSVSGSHESPCGEASADHAVARNNKGKTVVPHHACCGARGPWISRHHAKIAVRHHAPPRNRAASLDHGYLKRRAPGQINGDNIERVESTIKKFLQHPAVFYQQRIARFFHCNAGTFFFESEHRFGDNNAICRFIGKQGYIGNWMANG